MSNGAIVSGMGARTLTDTNAPIFKRLVDDCLVESDDHSSSSRYSAKLLSCPNIAVRCDIVEYL